MNNILTLRKPNRITCAWVPTGNTKLPLACIWTKAEASTAPSSPTKESGRMHHCA